ncbi:hypothetical protein PFICI_13420 [Pestalotiopsis fici W106-1]|uniref:Uncharacterized protein n=1 Tax=Pestalotiopsis fici (strain W106-1 / CGMCC3.15140) TaxID=1229662 RepID=W3WQ34_PESFW|nr:uncharacterized protein PFICI_13420 [Pestalotiopsis fici W106-1]ETS74936.1 hypothetical protein PFICI_13420 [Pestalotiopsis fici W106-1]
MDITPIVIAIISLVASITVAGFGAYLNYSTVERKARREAEQLLQKYRDPLLFAAEDLQSRLWGIFHTDVLSFSGRSVHHDDALYIYTAFVLGQFLAWTHILRSQTQLLPFSLEEDQRLQKFLITLHNIQGVLLLSGTTESTAFTLWRGNQMAIGEFMTEVRDSEKMCMGFHDFTKIWKGASNDAHDDLHYWFDPVVVGLKTLAEKGPDVAEGNKLRRLQHLLVDLIEVLDPQKRRLQKGPIGPCGAASDCPCTRCRPLVHEPKAKKLGGRSSWWTKNSEIV